MRKLIVLLIVVVSVFIAVRSTSALAQTAPKCDTAAVFTQANALKSTGDAKKDIATLLKLSAAIDAQNIACNGFTFSAKVRKVFPSFELPKGVYKMTAATNGFIILDLNPLSGECGEGQYFDTSIFNESASPNAKYEALIYSNGCKAIITTDNTSAPYVITIEPLE